MEKRTRGSVSKSGSPVSMSNLARGPFPVRISPMREDANPSMAILPTKSSFDLVKPRVTGQTMSFFDWKNCPGILMTKLCAGATGAATVFFGWAVFLLPKLKLDDFFCGAADLVAVFFPTEGNFRALFTLKAFMLSFGVPFGSVSSVRGGSSARLALRFVSPGIAREPQHRRKA